MVSPFLAALEAVDAGQVALIDDARTWTYGDLRHAASRAACTLHHRYGHARYATVLMRPGAEAVALTVAAMYAGWTPVPVDPQLPPAALEYIEAKCGAACRLDPADFAALADEGAGTLAAQPSTQPALILFTSGTTGYPKGVIVSHDNLAHACRAISEYLDYARWRSAAVVLPLHYSYGLISQVFCQLSVGGRVAIFATMRNPIAVGKRITAMSLETFCGVPSTFLALATVHAMAPIVMPTVRVICSAGAAMDASRVSAIREMFPAATLFDNYGMTEAAPRIAYIRDDDPRFGTGTCGRPMSGVEVRVVDPETHRPLPDGTAGVLVVRGPNVTSGYLNDPEQTAAAFTDDGFLLSGDMATLRDGYIYIHGRADDMFNVGGEKTAPVEIERALLHHPAVDQVVVRGIADPQRGAIPVAFLTLRTAATKRDLMETARAHLSPARVPARYFEVSSFPTTSNGKVQRRLLTMDDRSRIRREIE